MVSYTWFHLPHQLLNSGNIGKEDLESLKGMLAQSMGMPVEEILERKEELQVTSTVVLGFT